MLYDRFQKEAIEYINKGYSVIVSAPTGAGKTAIAEYVIEDSLNKKCGVIYTAPLKALSNQKFRDFQKQFKEQIGILTGDVSINAHAPVLIMTTEIFRNKILDDPQSLRKYSWVIFDEIHYLDNPERGTVWEESLILMPAHLKILCLSATIPNIEEFWHWIESIHKKRLKVVVEEKRPVPLSFFYQCHNEIFSNLQALRQREKARYFCEKANRLNTLINYIQDKQGLPCIYFVFGRRRAEELAFELYNYDFLNSEEKREISLLYADLCQRFDLLNEPTQIKIAALIKKGIAFHHAGMLPTLKEVIERLFTSKLLKVIFTTETFALGINMPARSVVFDSLKKFYGRYVRCLKTRDFYQMAGRAGRRGLDKQGFVWCRINLQRINTKEIKQIIYGRPERVESQLNTSYATILNLYARHQEKLLDIYPASFHYFQSNKIKRENGLSLIKAKLRILKELSYIQNGNLSLKGEFCRGLYGYELLLGELNALGYLEQMHEAQLSILALASVFEPRKGQRQAPLSKNIQELEEICYKIILPIQKKEAKYRIYPLSKKPYFHLSASCQAWLNGASFEKILKFTDTDEGEVVRYFRMAVQILREIAATHTSSIELKQKVNRSIALINRDIVDAEKQLREG